ncbi:MAG: MipA/OmpV family protein [Sulfurovaceae bacterium]|nr:MipA/OmpV family protein [Sulfurovaceae bacterium]
MIKKFFLLLVFGYYINASELDLGIGIGDMYYPDYLGSNHENNMVIPFPFIDYHSKKLDIDKDGINQKLFSIDGLSARVSMNGSLPVTSSGARKGMDDLDTAGEIGPALVYKFYEQNGLTFKLDIPIRVVISTDWNSIDYRGYKTDPRIAIDYDIDGYLLQFQTGGVWADSEYSNYIYGVDSDDVIEDRAEYKAKAGYLGYKTSFGVSKKYKKIWTGAFIRHYSLNGAVSNGSPLKRQNYAIYGSIFIAYLFDRKFSEKLKKWLD